MCLDSLSDLRGAVHTILRMSDNRSASHEGYGLVVGCTTTCPVTNKSVEIEVEIISPDEVFNKWAEYSCTHCNENHVGTLYNGLS